MASRNALTFYGTMRNQGWKWHNWIRNALTSYRAIRIKARKADKQKCTYPLWNNRNQGWESRASRNALTFYRTMINQSWESITTRNALTFYRTIRIKAGKAWQSNWLTFYRTVGTMAEETWQAEMQCTHRLQNNKNQNWELESMTTRNAFTSYKTIRIKAEKVWQSEMHCTHILQTIRPKAEKAWQLQVKIHCTHILQTNKTQGWEGMTTRSALTNYRTIKNQGWEGKTTRNSLTSFRTIRIETEKVWQPEMYSPTIEQ